MGKKGKKYPAHHIARKKKFLMARNHPPPPSRVKWSAPKATSNKASAFHWLMMMLTLKAGLRSCSF